MEQSQQNGDNDFLPALSLEKCLKDSSESISWDRGIKRSSFDLFNILKDSDQLVKREARNSLQLFNSQMGLFERTSGQSNRASGHLYKDEDRVKIQSQTGNRAIQIGQVYSDDQEQSYSSNLPNIKQEEQRDMKPEDLDGILPLNLVKLLEEHQIPMEYVRGLMYLRNQKQVKTARRLRVQRYLEKRRKKTWNRKICYNCRQKVAQQRLRIKGKFIKKRRAMEILGIKGHIPTPQLKRRLQKSLKGKSASQIQRIIKIQE